MNREKLWKILIDFGSPTKLINMIKLCSARIPAAGVKVNNEISSSFITNSGLKQADAMSPVLFNVALESVMRKISRTDISINRDEGNVLLAYADDIVVIGNSREGIHRVLLKELIKMGKDIGLTVNRETTKYMMINIHSRYYLYFDSSF